MSNTDPTHDDFLDYLSKAAQAAAALHERDEAQGTPQETPPSGIPDGPEVLHIYIVDERPTEPEAPVVESTIETTSKPRPDPDTGEQAVPLTETPSKETRSTRKRWIIGVGIGACVVLALVNLVLYGPLLFGGAPVTVTILPQAQAVSTTLSVPLSTNGAARGALAGRMLSTLTLSQEKTVPTTGTGHAPAQSGRGHVTFYNAAPSVQTIPAGTLLTGKDGVEVVTDQDAVISAGTLATNGQVTVSAQTVNTGPSGNIAAQDIYGACCRVGVYVQNTAAFTGGQDAHTYPMVTYQDVAKAEASLRASLMQSVRAAFQAELAPSESLITPVPCKEQVDSSAGLYAEATSLTIELTETCADVAYDTSALTSLVTGQLDRQAERTLSSGYGLVGNVTIHLVKVTPEMGKPSLLLLTVKGTETWMYQFSEAALEQMAGMIAGKSASQATGILLHQPGVSQVELGTSGMLPTNADRIHVLVVEQGM